MSDATAREATETYHRFVATRDEVEGRAEIERHHGWLLDRMRQTDDPLPLKPAWGREGWNTPG